MTTAHPFEKYWRDETLRDWLDHHAGHAPDQVAILGPNTRWSYGELHARAIGLAARLRSLGIGRGDVVAIQLPNLPEFVLTYLATGYAGAILQTLHMPYRGAEIEFLLQHSGAKAIVCMGQGKDFNPAEAVLAMKPRLPALAHVIALGSNPPPGALPFEARPATASLESRPQADDDFVLLYTSGTVAAPKGVPTPYRKFLANARMSAPEHEIGPRSILLTAASLSHLYGLFAVNLTFAAGATMALLPAFTPPALAEALDTYRPTQLFTAPAHMTACLQAGLLTPERLGSLAMLQISGSACPPELARRIQDMMPNGKVTQLWGMSELQAGAFNRPSDPLEARMTSAGRASPGTELRITLDGAPVGAGEEGELQVRGCSVFDGYLGNADATADAFTADGWFCTGDLARMTADGNIRITGRLKDVINRGGVKFNPADIEALIDRHPAVLQCAIAPLPDPAMGERACCFAVLKSGATLSLDDIRAFLTQHDIAKTKWPERVEIVDEMPLTPTRKIKKAELVKALLAKP
ncbi:MAG: class I adenylate-forming enzyme family protein [Pseudorhodoplanes sp.]|uniref:class I adenylate-forming enzyme family protein n=1 Tax=Pseudorhodoplanes sp. TaxID=1934341 RepID=UPI003D0A50FE